MANLWEPKANPEWPSGRPVSTLTALTMAAGVSLLTAATVYSASRQSGQTLWERLWSPAWQVGVYSFVVLLVWALPKDVKRYRIRKYGRRLRGPYSVWASEFNRWHQSDGIGFSNENRCFWERVLRTGHRVNIPRQWEAMHFLIMGDAGPGKSTVFRQILSQIEQRGETAIVYDPALEYVSQFYQPGRGDVILNAMDTRTPHWSPAVEVIRETDALTIADSLFPENDPDKNRPLMKAPRRIFAHLLQQKPALEELIAWMTDEGELENKLEGTPIKAMLYASGSSQRGWVLAELSMVADILRLLPRRGEAIGTWTATEWAKERRGWIFLTSIPELRQGLAPLVSLWIDLLALRVINQGRPGRVPVWFVLDEFATLQKLPQLQIALTEKHKWPSPIVLGVQGKGQLEKVHGSDTEAILSRPLTKIFLRTSETTTAKWISQTIGNQEVQRLAENNRSERVTAPLVMDSQITGLADFCAYLNSGNGVVELHFSSIGLPNRSDAFVERELQPEQRKVEEAVMHRSPNVPPPAPSEPPMIHKSTNKEREVLPTQIQVQPPPQIQPPQLAQSAVANQDEEEPFWE